MGEKKEGMMGEKKEGRKEKGMMTCLLFGIIKTTINGYRWLTMVVSGNLVSTCLLTILCNV